jgi:hypothetical protein
MPISQDRRDLAMSCGDQGRHALADDPFVGQDS